MPPRHGKSLLCSRMFPAWYLGRNPHHRIIAASYAQALANDFGRAVRNTIADDRYQSVFTGSRLASDSSAIQKFDLDAGGGYFAAGVGGPITGKGGDLIIVDDPVANREAAQSQLQRESLWTWFTTVLDTRRAPNAKMLLIMTRWHDDDLAGRIMKLESEKWKVLSLPAINDKGEALWPEAYPISDLLDRKQKMGRDFEALYQQNPMPLKGALFKRHWWKSYATAPATFKRIVQFMDCAQKVGVSNDYSVCATWGETDAGYYLLDVWRHKVEAPDLERATKSNYEKWKPNALVIEDKSSGSSLIQALRQKTRIPVIAYDPKARDKIVRASAATPLVESGRCHLPDSAPWLEDFLIEHERFPASSHDDQVDTTSMMSEYFSAQPNYNIRSF